MLEDKYYCNNCYEGFKKPPKICHRCGNKSIKQKVNNQETIKKTLKSNEVDPDSLGDPKITRQKSQAVLARLINENPDFYKRFMPKSFKKFYKNNESTESAE